MDFIFELGGRQFIASKGQTLVLPKIEGEVGDTVDLKVIADFSKGDAFVSSSIKAEIKEHKRSKKIIVFKKKRRQRYERKMGHRTQLTVVKVS